MLRVPRDGSVDVIDHIANVDGRVWHALPPVLLNPCSGSRVGPAQTPAVQQVAPQPRTRSRPRSSAHTTVPLSRARRASRHHNPNRRARRRDFAGPPATCPPRCVAKRLTTPIVNTKENALEAEIVEVRDSAMAAFDQT